MSKKQTTLFQSWGQQKNGNEKASTSAASDSTSSTIEQPGPAHDDQVIDLCFDDDDDDDILFEAEDTVINPDLSHGDKEDAANDEESVCNISIGADGFMSTQGQASNLPGFDRNAGRRWIYPTNYPVREYQFKIVEQSLFKNTMVTLPTGLGKTFIAAVLMYNFYRWYPEGKVIFMAPTKPLVAQQIEACYNIMGIPQQHTAEMTGSMGPPKREKAWHEKRVFFLTPQVLTNDLSRGTCPAQMVKCVVIDEAHKALGNHAYCQVVRELVKYTESFRVLALSATPGSDIKAVQQVLTNLLISHIEIRTEESADIKSYSHERKVDKIVVPLGEELTRVKDKYIHIMDLVVGRLKRHGVVYNRDTTSLSKFLILKSRDAFRQNPPEQLPKNQYGVVEGDFALAMSLYHGFELLQLHGSRSLYNYLEGIVSGDKGYGRTRTELCRNGDFTELMSDLAHKYRDTQSQSTKAFVTGHPKMEKLQEIVLDHFNTHKATGTATRVMIFSQYRDSVQEITDMLQVHEPVVKVMSFIGQASAGKATKGFTQKEQLMVMKQFREGGYNTLVSTCVGEEGLDIGDVDLIICFDAHKSPIRLVQRMGRTGRKREGRIVMLVTKGKEEQIYNQSQYSKKTIHKAILNGARSLHFYQNSPRMVPDHFHPTIHKMFITVKETFIPTKKISTVKMVQRKITAPISATSKSDTTDDPSSEILTLEEYREVKPFLFPDMDLPLLPGPQLTCLDPHTDSVETDPPGRFLSLSEWTSWQTTLQQTERVDHSLASRHLVELMEFIQLQQILPSGEDPYGLEMSAYLNEEDILQPGLGDADQPQGILPKVNTLQTAKRHQGDSKVKKRYSDALPALEQLGDAASGDSGEELPAFDVGHKVPVDNMDSYDTCADGNGAIREVIDNHATVINKNSNAISEIEQKGASKQNSKTGNCTAVQIKSKRKSVQSKARLMETKMNQRKIRKQKKKRPSCGQRSIVELLADSDSNDFDTALPPEVNDNGTINEQTTGVSKLNKGLNATSQGKTCVLLEEEEDEVDKLYMVRTPPPIEAAVLACENLSDGSAAKLSIEDIIHEWQQENEQGKYILMSRSMSQKLENSFVFDDKSISSERMAPFVKGDLVKTQYLSTALDPGQINERNKYFVNDKNSSIEEECEFSFGHDAITEPDKDIDTDTFHELNAQTSEQHVQEAHSDVEKDNRADTNVSPISAVADTFIMMSGTFDVGGDFLESSSDMEDICIGEVNEFPDKVNDIYKKVNSGDLTLDLEKHRCKSPEKISNSERKENHDKQSIIGGSPEKDSTINRKRISYKTTPCVKQSFNTTNSRTIPASVCQSEDDEDIVKADKACDSHRDYHTQFTFTQAMACVQTGSSGSHSEPSITEDQVAYPEENCQRKTHPATSVVDQVFCDPGKDEVFEETHELMNKKNPVQRNVNDVRFERPVPQTENKVSSFSDLEPSADVTCLSEALFDDELEESNVNEGYLHTNRKSDASKTDTSVDNDKNVSFIERSLSKPSNAMETVCKGSSSSDDNLDLPQFDLGFDIDADVIPPSPNFSDASQMSTSSVFSQPFSKRLSQGLFFGLNVSSKSNETMNNKTHLDKTNHNMLRSTSGTEHTVKSLKSKRSLNLNFFTATKVGGAEKNVRDPESTKDSLPAIPEDETNTISGSADNVMKHSLTSVNPSEHTAKQATTEKVTFPRTSVMSTLFLDDDHDGEVEPDTELCFNLLDDGIDDWVNSGLDVENKDEDDCAVPSVDTVKKGSCALEMSPIGTLHCKLKQTENNQGDNDIKKHLVQKQHRSSHKLKSTVNSTVISKKKSPNTTHTDSSDASFTGLRKTDGRKSIFGADDLSSDSMDDFSFEIPKLNLKLPEFSVSPPEAPSPAVTPAKPVNTVCPFNIRESTPVLTKTVGRSFGWVASSRAKVTEIEEVIEDAEQDDSFIVRRRRKSGALMSPNTSTESFKDEANAIQISQGFNESICQVPRRGGNKRKILISSDEEENQERPNNTEDDDDFDDSLMMRNNDYLTKKTIETDTSKTSTNISDDLRERSINSNNSRASFFSKSVTFSDDVDDDFEDSCIGPFKQIKSLKNDKSGSNVAKKSHENGQFMIKKKKKSSNPFVEDEAELSDDGEGASEDEDENSDQDVYEGSFIADSQFSQSQQLNQTDVHALYLKSVRSPLHQKGQFKLQYNYKDVDVFSQAPRENGEKSQYMEDSFCVGSTDEEEEAGDEWMLDNNETTEVTVISPDVTILKTGRKRKKGAMAMQTGRQRAIHFGRMKALDEIKAKLGGKNTRKALAEKVPENNTNETKTCLPKKRRIQVLDDSSSDEDRLQNISINSPDIQKIGHAKKKARLVLSSSDEGDFEAKLNISSVKKSKGKLMEKSRVNMSRIKSNVSDSVNIATQNDADVLHENPRIERLRKQKLQQEEFKKRLSKISEVNVEIPVNKTEVANTDGNRLTKIKAKHETRTEASELDTNTADDDYGVAPLHKDRNSAGNPNMLVDSKEVSGAQDIISDLRFKHSVHVSAAQLPGCDYIVSNRMAVERKQWSEFSNGTNRAKLIERLQHLAELYDRMYLVVEKDRVKPGEEKSARPIHWTKYLDRTIALLHRSGHKVLFTDSQAETACLLADLARLEQRKGMAISVPVDVSEERAFRLKFYGSLPKLSYIHALNLCDGFRSVSEFLKSSVALIEKHGKMSRNRAMDVHAYARRTFDSNMLPTRLK